MNHTQSFTVAATLMALTISVFSACSGGDQKKPGAPVTAVTVILGKAGTAAADAVLASGQVEAAQTAGISTRVMGRINAIYVKEGDRVSKGQVLATISDEDIRAKRAQTGAMIAEAEAAFATVQKDYDRFGQLYKEQSATARELDQVTLQYNAAKQRVEAARQMRNEVNAMLSYTSLTAPFSGVVTRKMAEAGTLASPGMPILTIEQSGILQISASVAEADISLLKTGDPAEVEVKSSGVRFRGAISQLVPSSQFTGGQYMVKISIPETARKDLYAGMFVRVSFPVKQALPVAGAALLTIPVSAVVYRDELTGIYTVGQGNTALLRWIRLGRRVGDQVEVISGLGKEEDYILSAEGKLYNGVPVAVKK
jgi:RND family efflux transporter MFP subunit